MCLVVLDEVKDSFHWERSCDIGTWTVIVSNKYSTFGIMDIFKTLILPKKDMS